MAESETMSRSKKNPYSGTKAADKSCRSHGSCPHCENGRKHKKERQLPALSGLASEESIIPEGDDSFVVFQGSTAS